MKVIAIAVFMLSAVGNAQAAGKVASGLVTKIVVQGDYFYVSLAGNPQFCDNAGGQVSWKSLAQVQVGKNGFTADTLRLAHSSATTSLLAGRSVTIHGTDNADGACLALLHQKQVALSVVS